MVQTALTHHISSPYGCTNIVLNPKTLRVNPLKLDIMTTTSSFEWQEFGFGLAIFGDEDSRKTLGCWTVQAQKNTWYVKMKHADENDEHMDLNQQVCVCSNPYRKDKYSNRGLNSDRWGINMGLPHVSTNKSGLEGGTKYVHDTGPKV